MLQPEAEAEGAFGPAWAVREHWHEAEVKDEADVEPVEDEVEGEAGAEVERAVLGLGAARAPDDAVVGFVVQVIAGVEATVRGHCHWPEAE